MTDDINFLLKEAPHFWQGWKDATKTLDALPTEYSEQHEYWRGYAHAIIGELNPSALRPKWTEPFHAIRFWLTHR